MPEQSAAERIYANFLQDIPVEMRPLARSLVVSRIAAHQEKPYNPKVGETWMINSEFLDQEINNLNKEAVLNRAVWLTTLPKHKDEQIEYYYRWLRGNGLTILQDKRMSDTLNAFMDDQEKSKPLTNALVSFLSTDVTGFDQASISDVPESYSLFTAFLVVDSLAYDPETRNRKKLIHMAQERLVNDFEVNRVMDIFGVIEDTKPLFERFDVYRQNVRVSIENRGE